MKKSEFYSKINKLSESDDLEQMLHVLGYFIVTGLFTWPILVQFCIIFTDNPWILTALSFGIAIVYSIISDFIGKYTDNVYNSIIFGNIVYALMVAYTLSNTDEQTNTMNLFVVFSFFMRIHFSYKLTDYVKEL